MLLVVWALVPATAAAGPPGNWTRVTGSPQAGHNTDQVGLARTDDGVLHVAYTVNPPGGPDTLMHRAIAADAKSVSDADAGCTAAHDAQ